MDLTKTIDLIRDELACIEAAIAALERVAQFEPVPIPMVKSRRGRKSMGAEERLIVSARMKRYWTSRRYRETANSQRPQERRTQARDSVQKAPSRQHVSRPETGGSTNAT